jgi:hypothetical protein
MRGSNASGTLSTVALWLGIFALVAGNPLIDFVIGPLALINITPIGLIMAAVAVLFAAASIRERSRRSMTALVISLIALAQNLAMFSVCHDFKLGHYG